MICGATRIVIILPSEEDTGKLIICCIIMTNYTSVDDSLIVTPHAHFERLRQALTLRWLELHAILTCIFVIVREGW